MEGRYTELVERVTELMCAQMLKDSDVLIGQGRGLERMVQDLLRQVGCGR